MSIKGKDEGKLKSLMYEDIIFIELFDVSKSKILFYCEYLSVY